MNEIDMRSIVFGYLLMDIAITIVMTVLWTQNRKRFSGSGYWLTNFIFVTSSVILIALRGSIPDWLSISVSNILLISGNLLGLIAFERFLGLKRKHTFNFLLIVVFAFIHAWFTYKNNSLSIRNLNLGIFIFIISIQYVWLAFFKRDTSLKRLTLGVGLVFSGYCIINLLRIINFFKGGGESNEYFSSGSFEKFIFFSYQILFLFLAYSVALLYNRRLLMDIAFGEEKFSKAFYSSPYAILISRLSDGVIIDVNRGFEKITGFSRTEALKRNTVELTLWTEEAGRLNYIEELLQLGKISEKEIDFRIRNGEIKTCLTSSEMIIVNNERCIISSINDITERKKVEAEVKLNEARLESLLRISHSESNTLQSFLDNALKEAILLTQSEIGYIYFYSEEKREFTLNSWSEKVMDSCKVLEPQTIYQLEKTGIWGEAVRQRKPIVINDFHAANPHKKGYPEGHVQLDKFMTIPVFADNQIVAVVAVANKKSDYNEADVRQLALMMGTVWNITEKMRITESLKETQAMLQAAMDCSPSGIAIADAPDGMLRYVNKAGLMIPAKTMEEVVEDVDINKYVSSWKIKHHDGTPYKPDEVPLARAVMYGETNSREFIISRDDSDNRVVLANAAPILDSYGKVKAGIVVFHDITDYKKADKLLYEKINELEKFNKIMVGRELKMIELKKEINELCSRLNIPKRYKATEESSR